MVGALEEVAYTNNITKMGEGIMNDVVELCTILTTRGADTLTTCSNRMREEEQDQSHHQEEDRGHPLKEYQGIKL